jgi:ATP-binding cassette, subfamily B, bacterial
MTAQERLSVASVLLGLARARPALFVGSSLTVFLHYLLILLPGLVLQAFFDALTGRRAAGIDPYSLAALLAAIAVLQGVQGFVGVLEQVLRVAASLLMRRNLLAAVLRRPGARALPGSPGEAVGRMRDDVDAVSIALTYALDPLGMVVMVGTALVALSRVNGLVTAVVVLPAVAVMVIVNAFGRRIATYRQAAQQSAADVTGMISETFAAFATIKGAGAEERAGERFAELCSVRLRAVQRDLALSQIIDAVATNLSTVAVGGILLLVPRALHQGTFTVGDLALFVSYLARLSTVTGFVGQYATIYRQVRVSLARLQPLLLGEPASALVEPHALEPRQEPVRPARNPVAGLPLKSVSLRGLTHLHPAGGGIRGVDLDLLAGSFTVVTGPVGAGKTTLLRTVLGLLPLQAGEIRWNGELVTRPDLWMVPPRCAFTPQVPRLFTASVEENIMLGLAGGEGAALAAARTAVMEADLEHLDRGLETSVGPRGVRLSGGQLQRVAAARMLARAPALMVFDDVSSALDTVTEAELWRRLRADHPRAALLAVSHRPAVVAMADQVLRLERGRPVTPEAFRR